MKSHWRRGWGWSVALEHLALIFRKVIMKTILAVAAMAALVALPACNTTAGFGKDVQATGNAIENVAMKQKK